MSRRRRQYEDVPELAPVEEAPAPAPVAPAEPTIVKLDNRTFALVPQTASAVTTIDGYIFVGMPYYDPDETKPSAVVTWWKLLADPNYASLPPVTSISVDSTVSGNVDPVEPPA